MPKIRVLVPHASSIGIGTWRVGDVYEDAPLAARQKVAHGFAEFVDPSEQVRTKEDPDMYRTRQISVGATSEQVNSIPVGAEDVTITSRAGNWYHFSDGEKVLGKTAAADKLGVSVEELDGVDPDDG